MAIKRAKISAQIYKQLDRKGLLKDIQILRSGLNDFEEPITNQDVCKIKGYYHRNNLKLYTTTSDGATLTSGYEERLLVIINDESKKIKQDDYFTLDNVKYKIIDLGDVEGIVFDMSLERK